MKKLLLTIVLVILVASAFIFIYKNRIMENKNTEYKNTETFQKSSVKKFDTGSYRSPESSFVVEISNLIIEKLSK